MYVDPIHQEAIGLKRDPSNRAIIFDFDGTLADTRKPIMQSIWEALHTMNIALPSQRSIEALSCYTLETMFQKIGIRDKDKIDQAVYQYNRSYRRLGPQKATLYPGVEDTLSQLKADGYLLSIGTHERRHNLDRLIHALKIGRFFSNSLCEDEVCGKKPSPEMAETLMHRLGVLPEETLIVGDSTLDIRMGKAAECDTCAVTYGAHSKDQLTQQTPDYIINMLPELLSVLAVHASRRRMSVT